MLNYLFHAAIVMCLLALITVKTILLFQLDSAELLARLQYLDWGLAWLLPALWLGERHFAKRRRTQNGVYLVALRGELPCHIRKVDPEEILEQAQLHCKLRERIVWESPFTGTRQIWYRKGGEWVEETLPLAELKDSLDAAQRALLANGGNFRIFRSLPELLKWIDDNDFRRIPAVQRLFQPCKTERWLQKEAGQHPAS